MFSGAAVLKDLQVKYGDRKRKRKENKTTFDRKQFLQENKHINDELDRSLIGSKYCTDMIQKCLDSLDKLNFKIVAFWKRENKPGKGHCMKERDDFVFVCRYQDWAFTCGWGPCDIEVGIFALRDPVNIKTNESVEFYCDIFCNNTTEERLNRIIKMMETSHQEVLEEMYNQKIALLEQMKERGFGITKLQEKRSLTHPEIHYLVTVPENLQSKSDTVWQKKLDFKPFHEQYKRENENISAHRYYFNIFDGWWNNIVYTFSTKEDMDVNGYKVLRDVSSYWSDIKEFTVDGYVNALLRLDRIVHGCYGLLENGKYYNGTHLKKIVSNLNKSCPKNGSTSICARYESMPLSGSNVINSIVKFQTSKTFFWYSDMGTCYVSEFDHTINAEVVCLEADTEITVKVTENCTVKTSVNGKLKEGDVSQAGIEPFCEKSETKHFKWNELTNYINSQFEQFKLEYTPFVKDSQVSVWKPKFC
jgi:hypothetical protein